MTSSKIIIYSYSMKIRVLRWLTDHPKSQMDALALSALFALLQSKLTPRSLSTFLELQDEIGMRKTLLDISWLH